MKAGKAVSVQAVSLRTLDKGIRRIRRTFRLHPEGGPWWHEVLDQELTHLYREMERALAPRRA